MYKVYAKYWNLYVKIKVINFVDLKPLDGKWLPIFVIDHFDEGLPSFLAVDLNQNPTKISGPTANVFKSELPNFPYGTPYSILSVDTIEAVKDDGHFAIPDLHQAVGFVLSHEIDEIIADFNYSTFVAFQNVRSRWNFKNAVNGIQPNFSPIASIGTNGLYDLPDLPEGLIFGQLENADPTAWGKENQFEWGPKKNRWLLVNFPFPNFYNPWQNSSKYDYLGLLTQPMVPKGGYVEVFYVDPADGVLQQGLLVSQPQGYDSAAPPSFVYFISVGPFFPPLSDAVKQVHNILKNKIVDQKCLHNIGLML